MWRQYLAMPVPFLVIALAYPLAHLRNAEQSSSKRPFTIATMVLSAAVTLAVVNNPIVLSRPLAVLVPEHWVPTKLHRLSGRIVGDMPEPKRALTLGPLYAIEGGGDIYPELASGAIVYRIADSLSADERAVTGTVGPQTLPKLVEESPPALVILGAEPSYFAFLEDPLREMVTPNWTRQTHEHLIAYRRP